jgi:dipeptidyl aminopeptidase/acylaminoacyl peptidase
MYEFFCSGGVMKQRIFLLALLVVVFPLAGFADEVIFSGQVEGQFDLFKANLKTGQTVQLTKTEAEELMPCVSRDGKMVAFVSNRQGANSLYLASANDLEKAKYISVGVGAYANPCFSPDGSKIVVQYSPDPEAHFKDTRLVIVDYQKQHQQILVDSKALAIPENSETVAVVDRPLWVSENLVVYILAEFADELAGRLTRSTLYMYDIKNNRHIRMGGGESYFTGEGRPMGFKAALPSLLESSEKAKTVAFAAIRGNVDRKPMKLSLTGAGKGTLPLNDPDFFGPMLFNGKTWVYGIIDDEGMNRLAYRIDNLNAPRQVISFPGQIIYPALLTP